MTINLTPQQIAWLQAFAAERGFASVDEAAQFLIGEAIRDVEDLDLDNLDWVKPYIDEAEEDIKRGAKLITLEEFKAHLKKRIEELDR